MKEEEVDPHYLYLTTLQTLNEVPSHPDVSDAPIAAEVH